MKKESVRVFGNIDIDNYIVRNERNSEVEKRVINKLCQIVSNEIRARFETKGKDLWNLPVRRFQYDIEISMKNEVVK